MGGSEAMLGLLAAAMESDDEDVVLQVRINAAFDYKPD